MPYGIKGKTKNWEESTKAGRETDNRIESCVAGLMGDKSFKPRDGEDKKAAAIRVCKSSITRSREFKNKLG